MQQDEVPERRAAHSHNTASNVVPSFDEDYGCRSIAFGARELIVHSAKSNGIVCRDVMCHAGTERRNRYELPQIQTDMALPCPYICIMCQERKEIDNVTRR